MKERDACQLDGEPLANIAAGSQQQTTKRQRWAAREIMVVLGGCATLVGLSYFVLDRPLADFARIHVQGPKAFVWLTYISKPLRPLALMALVGIGVRVAAGYPLGRYGRSVLLASLALVVAWVFTQELKYVFGSRSSRLPP
jgi:hypothetical protein